MKKCGKIVRRTYMQMVIIAYVKSSNLNLYRAGMVHMYIVECTVLQSKVPTVL
jgi:hypothetical protein